MGSTIGIQNLIMALQQALVPSSYQGTVGVGSTDTQVVDSVGGFATNQWADWGIQFTQDTATAALRGVWRQITSNTGTTHSVAALPAVPAAGDTYNIRMFGEMNLDLRAVGGTTQTGANWTPLLQAIGVVADAAVTDPAVAATAVAALKGLLTDLGQNADAAVAAGDPGSLSAKARRLTTDLGAALARLDITLSALRDAVTGAGAAARTLGDVDTGLDSLNAKDFATQTTLAAVLAAVDGVEGLLTTLNAKDFATQTTLAAQLNITLSALRDAVAGAAPNNATLFTLAGYLDGVEGLLSNINAKDFATQATLASVLSAVDTLEASIGATGDAAVVNPALAASVIAVLKGLLTVEGTVNDVALTDPTVAATIVSLLKGLLTDIGQNADAIVAAGAAGSASAKLRRLTSDLGGILTAAGTTADAAVTNPAAAASLIAALKGLLTDIGASTDGIVTAGAEGTLSSKLRRATTDLGTLTGLVRSPSRAVINSAAGGDITVVAGQGVGTFIHVIYVEVVNASDTDLTIILKDNATAINGAGYQLAKRAAGANDGGYFFDGMAGQKELVLGDNAPLVLNVSALKQVSGFVLYYVA